MSNELIAATPELDILERRVAIAERQQDAVKAMAGIYSSSTLVPKEFQKNTENCVIALNMAERMRADPLMVMQNLYIVHGRPSWSSQFLIAAFNQCGRFSAMRFEFVDSDKGDQLGCFAYATELATGEKVKGSIIRLSMAKAEGWSTKNGSKWKTMPQQMLQYRAASFFVRTTAPEITMGLPSEHESYDVGPVREVESVSPAANLSAALESGGNAERDWAAEIAAAGDPQTLDELAKEIERDAGTGMLSTGEAASLTDQISERFNAIQ